MTMEERLCGYLGIAAKGKMLVSGGFSVEKAVKSGRAGLVLTAGDASENTKKKFRNMCEFYGVPFCVFSDSATMGRVIGRGFRMTCAVTDGRLAQAVAALLECDGA